MQLLDKFSGVDPHVTDGRKFKDGLFLGAEPGENSYI